MERGKHWSDGEGRTKIKPYSVLYRIVTELCRKRGKNRVRLKCENSLLYREFCMKFGVYNKLDTGKSLFLGDWTAKRGDLTGFSEQNEGLRSDIRGPGHEYGSVGIVDNINKYNTLIAE